MKLFSPLTVALLIFIASLGANAQITHVLWLDGSTVHFHAIGGDTSSYPVHNFTYRFARVLNNLKIGFEYNGSANFIYSGKIDNISINSATTRAGNLTSLQAISAAGAATGSGGGGGGGGDASAINQVTGNNLLTTINTSADSIEARSQRQLTELTRLLARADTANARLLRAISPAYVTKTHTTTIATAAGSIAGASFLEVQLEVAAGTTGATYNIGGANMALQEGDVLVWSIFDRLVNNTNQVVNIPTINYNPGSGGTIYVRTISK